MKSAVVAIKGTGYSSLKCLEAESAILGRSFYARPTVEVARELVGKILVHRGTAGRIVEVEGYLGQGDRAAHAWRGLTGRTRVLFGPPGHAYVFLVYGMYECLNLVAEPEGSPGCVLIRALEPLAGIPAMRRRRGQAASLETLASGPGRLTMAMGIDRRLNGADVTRGPLVVRKFAGERPGEILTTPRIGIRHGTERLLRFVAADNPFVSRHCIGIK